MKILSVSILAFFLFGCSACSEKTTGGSDTKQNAVAVDLSKSILKTDSIHAETKKESSVTDSVAAKAKDNEQNNYRFIVSFYSIGAGTEQKQIEKFENFLTGYRQKTGKSISAEKTSWGREGELDFCLNLSEISSNDQLNFIRDAKEELKTARWVNFSENSPCRKKTGRGNR